MGSLSGIIQRPLVAAAVAIASVSSASADLYEKFSPSKSLETCSSLEQSTSFRSNETYQMNDSWVSYISASKLDNLSFVNKVRVRVPDIDNRISNIYRSFVPHNVITPSFVLLIPYQSANLANVPKPTAYTKSTPTFALSPEVLYRWHLPEPSTLDVSGNSDCSSAKCRTVVVLLGWLGAKQKHLKKYADWYTERGFHVITFTFPMAEILSYKVGGKAEQHIELLANHLADWLDEENRKNVVFHTFSNTGWLTYGVVLEKLQKQDPNLLGRIKGCIVDSAPVAVPDPQVWASGFSAAFLKKRSVATKGYNMSTDGPAIETSHVTSSIVDPKPALTEAALLLLLEKFFEVFLNFPKVNRRLSDVLNVLTSGQPSCPQLYIYSSADKVIPAGSVESFIEEQQKAGHEVRACNFVSTPHVDHFRHDPQLYTSQLTTFLEDCVLACCRKS